MRIRTITTGVTLDQGIQKDVIKTAAVFNRQAKDAFLSEGVEVQTTRIATNSWEEYLGGTTPEGVLSSMNELDDLCDQLGVDFFSVGPAKTAENISLLPNIIKNTKHISTSAKLGSHKDGINLENVYASARTIIRNSQESPDGLGNFLFCAWSNCQPGIPFFPAAYHWGEPSFALGLESGDLVMKAFTGAGTLAEGAVNLEKIMVEELGPLINICYELSKKFGMEFDGIDVSPAPSLERQGSVAWAFEKLGMGKFGQSGTLAVAETVTRVLKALPLKKCGYSGLMLPVCEDLGLCEAANEDRFNISNLLMYSAVCGCGLDTVPVPGEVSVERLRGILMDMAALANKLDKPLSARILPVAGREAGNMTSFNSPYLAECRVLDL